MAVSERWWPDGSGGILASHLIAELLRDAGFKLTIVHGTKEPLRLNGVRYVYSSLLSVRDKHRLWLNCSILARKHWFLKLISSSDVVYIPRYCYPLIPVIKKLGKRVVVHLHDYQPVSYNSIVFSKQMARSRVNAVSFEVLEHGSIARALLAGFTSPVNRLCRVWLKDADAVICVSRRQAELISELASELTEKLKVVYNPLPNIPLVEKNLGDPTFLYLGGDSYVKGFPIFLRASQEVLKRNLNVKFLLAGDFKDVNRLIIEKLNGSFKRAYSLLGYLKHEEVSKLYSISYALLFPSICEEPLPYAVLEAMLTGTIPIASEVGGVPEIIGGTLAEKMLFEPGNVGELVGRMGSVLTMSSEQIADVGYKLREVVVKKFDPEVVKRELIKMFSAE
ncbi:MAG: glycosyltransferase family 4 protein [Candidatus Bathyarchaeia archaeon]